MLPDHDLDDLLTEMVSRVNSLTDQVNELQRLEHAMAQNHGWIDGAWQKDPLSLGYSDIVARVVVEQNLSAGFNLLNDSAVPAGEIWVLTNISVLYIGTVANVQCTVLLNINGSYYQIWDFVPPASNRVGDRQGFWILHPGDYLAIEILNATAGDDLGLRGIGFRVDIDQ